MTDYEVYQRLGRGVFNSTHIIAAVSLGTRIYSVDFLPYRPKRYRKYHRIPDRRAEAHFFNNLGTEKMTWSNLQIAETYLQQAIQRDRNFAPAHNNLGVLLKRRGQLEEARRSYEKALDLDRNYLAAMENLSVLYRHFRLPEEAEMLERRIEKAKSRNPYYHVYRAYLAIQSKDYIGAREKLKQGMTRYVG